MKMALKQKETFTTLSKRPTMTVFPKTMSKDIPTISKNPTSTSPTNSATSTEVTSKRRNLWVSDIETFANTFTMVCQNVDDREAWLKFVIHESPTEYHGFDELMTFLSTTPSFIGYNWLAFDAQVIEYIWKDKIDDPRIIYNIAQEIINLTSKNKFGQPFKPWDLTFQSMDLFKIWHFDRSYVSLKQLEFFTRQRGIHDLPYEHTKDLSLKQVNELVKYNIKDVEFTTEFYDKSESRIQDRRDLYKKYGDGYAFNRSDSSMAEYEFATEIAESMGISYKKLADLPKVQYKDIKIKEILFDYYDFKSKAAKQIYDTFKKFSLQKTNGEFILKKALEEDLQYYGNSFFFGLGGAHYCVPPGDYKSENGFILVDADVSSYYPNICIQNNVSLSHIPADIFTSLYSSKYELRKTYDKGSSMNRRLKLQLNSIYGKSNEVNSRFYDPKYTCSITVNGQLSLLMLADWVYDEIPNVELLQLNTDGCTFKIPEDSIDEFHKICKSWEKLTKLELEFAKYNRMVIRDVNNYWAITDDGKVKRKGAYAIYEDYIDQEAYTKVPSTLVIPSAVDYYLQGKGTIEEHINNEDNIHEFLQGIKTDKRFDVFVWQAEDDGRVRIKSKVTDRYFRYYIAHRKIEGKNGIYGGSLYKHWTDGRVTGLNVDNLVSVQQFLRSERAELHPELNRQYYIDEAYKLINFI